MLANRIIRSSARFATNRASPIYGGSRHNFKLINPAKIYGGWRGYPHKKKDQSIPDDSVIDDIDKESEEHYDDPQYDDLPLEDENDPNSPYIRATFGAGNLKITSHHFTNGNRFPYAHAVNSPYTCWMNIDPTFRPPKYPEWEDIKKGDTGFINVLHFRFDPYMVSYEELVKHFFTFHDSTQKDRQGPFIGKPYGSYIFYHNKFQKAIAESYIARLQRHIDEKGPDSMHEKFNGTKV